MLCCHTFYHNLTMLKFLQHLYLGVTICRCNMKVDCPGGTDEDGCDFRCTPHGLFACKQQLLCVGMNKLCDGRKDCGDGSDENPEACAIGKCYHLSFHLVGFVAKSKGSDRYYFSKITQLIRSF